MSWSYIQRPLAHISIAACLAASSSSAATLSPMATFGGGDGWRAPNEIVTGDTAGTATGSNYNYLQAGSLERGLAYNPTTGNLVLVSRSASGNGIRLLNGTTGADVGALNQGVGVIAGGTFATNMAAAGTDGAIYVGNLASPVDALVPRAFTVYRWASEVSAAPTVAFTSSTITAGRMGDTLDAIGGGVSTLILAGESNSAGAGTRNGYAVMGTVDGANYTGTLVTFVGTPPAAGDFRLGNTFTDSDTVLGSPGGASSPPLRVTDFVGAAGTLAGNGALTSASERPMDYAVVGGVPVLATIDTVNSLVRVYDFTNPLAPALLVSGTTTSGTLAANGNAAGQVRWGAVNGNDATLYAMSSNQGIQAFNFQVPEPTTGIALLGVIWAGLGVFRRRG